MEALSKAWIYLLTPQSKLEYVWKTLILCMMTTTLAIIIETVSGSEISNPIPTYFLIVAVVSAPFFSFAMIQTLKLVRLQDELVTLATTDMLTGLDNRRSFFSKVEETAEGQFILLDIDHFKSINDRFGHSSGDEVLVLMAEHLRSCVNDNNVVARIGGEEFAVFVPNSDKVTSKQFAHRIVAGITLKLQGIDVKVTLSAGLATADPASPMSLTFRHADAALYLAKSSGRACFKTWSPDMLGTSAA